MYELDDLSTYNGDTLHDMWVDYSNHEYTGEPEVSFEDSNNHKLIFKNV